MSFVITIYVPEAIIMASDSRQSITIRKKGADGAQQAVETVNSDFVYKTFLLARQGVGLSTFGDFMLGKTTIESHIKRFQEEVLQDGDDVVQVIEKLLDFFRSRYPSADTAFHVAGFRKESGISIPYAFSCHVSRNELKRLNINPANREVVYGASWGGQGDVMAGLLNANHAAGHEGRLNVPWVPIVWDAMPVQDAIDFAIYAVRTTIDTIRFQARLKNVGGPIDVLLFTTEKVAWVQRKEFRGQMS